MAMLASAMRRNIGVEALRRVEKPFSWQSLSSAPKAPSLSTLATAKKPFAWQQQQRRTIVSRVEGVSTGVDFAKLETSELPFGWQQRRSFLSCRAPATVVEFDTLQRSESPFSWQHRPSPRQPLQQQLRSFRTQSFKTLDLPSVDLLKAADHPFMWQQKQNNGSVLDVNVLMVSEEPFAWQCAN